MSIRTYFENIADAIQEKSESSDTYTPAEMPSAIRSIPSGSSTASGVSYDNTSSGLTASNVQDAIDELSGDVSTINSDLTELKSNEIKHTTLTVTATQPGAGASATLPSGTIIAATLIWDEQAYAYAVSAGQLFAYAHTSNQVVLNLYGTGGRSATFTFDVLYK